MNITELISAIAEEANELNNSASAGGGKQYAFELTADQQELEDILQRLTDFGTRIRTEIAA